MPTLIAETGPLAGQRFGLAGRAVLGRGQMADLRLDDVTVSRRHCELRPAGLDWEVIDLGSSNGTRLNGAALTAPAVLADGDRLELGQLVLRFESDTVLKRREPEATVAPTASDGGRQAPGALFQDVLARITLFCAFGELVGREGPSTTLLEEALPALLRGLPAVEHAVLLVYVGATDRFAPRAARSRGEQRVDPRVLEPAGRVARAHVEGLLVCGPGDRAAQGARAPLPLDRDWAALPVRPGGEFLGALYLEASADAALRPGDRPALLAMAQFLGVLLAPELRRDGEAEAADRNDLALARRIQQRFLPQAVPQLPGYAVLDSYSAARTIGGDHFDYLTLPDGRTVLVVADVSGKAVSGALYMARLGPLLRHAAGDAEGPAALLTRLNAALAGELESGMFVTAVAVALDPASGRLEIASAGHPAPLLRLADGSVAALEPPRGPPLGVVAEARFEPAGYVLEPGQLVLLYSDGLDEAHDPQQNLLGLERVYAALAGADSAQRAVDALLDMLAAFVAGELPSDDLTLVVLERLRP